MDALKLTLSSPVGAVSLLVMLPLSLFDEKNESNKVEGFIDTIKYACEDMPALKKDIDLENCDTNNYNSIKSLCEQFNLNVKNIVALEKRTFLRSQQVKNYASRDLLRHILLQTYEEAVTDPKRLNQYQPFSSAVYGETSFDLVCQMIDQIKITPDDVFLDLGSGIGQVVLQMAAATECKVCLGIELADVPNEYAEAMKIHFSKWINWYGKKCGEYKLIKGDFLLERHRTIIKKATIIFVNNLLFSPDLDYALKQRFLSLKDGAIIVSPKSFCSSNFRPSDRNRDDIGAILQVSIMSPVIESASWTSKPVPFYLHTINRSKLNKCEK